MSSITQINFEKWASENLKDQGYLKQDHLHVDQANPDFKDRKNWMKGGLELFQKAIQYRNEKGLPFKIVLSIPLFSQTMGSEIEIPEIHKISLSMLNEWTPPSIYFYPSGKEPWLVNPKGFKKLPTDLLKHFSFPFELFYSEALHECEEDGISRAVDIAG